MEGWINPPDFPPFPSSIASSTLSESMTDRTDHTLLLTGFGLWGGGSGPLSTFWIFNHLPQYWDGESVLGSISFPYTSMLIRCRRTSTSEEGDTGTMVLDLLISAGLLRLLADYMSSKNPSCLSSHIRYTGVAHTAYIVMAQTREMTIKYR